jgi:hypothetical protein
MIEIANVKSALLTKSELEWLLGNNHNVSKAYQYKMKSEIRKKLKILNNLELPILQKSGIFSEDLTVFGNDLTVFGKVDNTINSSNIENCAQNMVGRKG